MRRPSSITRTRRSPRKMPFMNRNQFGATFGGPIKKRQAVLFRVLPGHARSRRRGCDQGRCRAAGSDRRPQRTRASSTRFSPVMENHLRGPDQPGSAWAILNAKLAQRPIPDSQRADHQSHRPVLLGYDAVVQGPNAQSTVNQGIANIDYVVSDKDRLTGKYLSSTTPTTNPFGSVGRLLGISAATSAGSQVASINNT
jgi:hypothetical protein